MQNQERQLPTVGNRVYFDNREEPTQSGWYLLHRVRNVSGSIDSPDALVTLCRENNEPGDYLSALASEISLTGPQTAPREPAEEWPQGAAVELVHSFSGALAERKAADADFRTRILKVITTVAGVVDGNEQARLDVIQRLASWSPARSERLDALLEEAKFVGSAQQTASTTHFDRHGQKLAVGQTVRIQHCNGRYGQTRLLTGTLQKIGAHGQVDVDTGKAGEGKCLYPGFSPDKSLGYGALRGYHEHVDFEHGHETWIEIID